MSKKFGRRAILTMGPAMAAAGVAAETDDPLQTVHSRVPGTGTFNMPVHFGPRAGPAPGEYKRTAGDTPYGDVHGISIAYLTDREMLSRFLPVPFELSGEPVVSISYSMNRQIEWLAGGAYNVIGVYVPATYKGKKDQVSGSYAMVLWENLTDPILTGREAQGIPKIFGDIEDYQVEGDSWRTSLSRNGHKILDIRASGLKPVPPDKIQPAHSLLLGWKYIPNETFTAPVVSYATAFPTGSKPEKAWTAQGSLEWHKNTWLQNPTQAHIVNAMQSLPIKEIRSCRVTQGSSSLGASQVRRLS